MGTYMSMVSSQLRHSTKKYFGSTITLNIYVNDLPDLCALQDVYKNCYMPMMQKSIKLLAKFLTSLNNASHCECSKELGPYLQNILRFGLRLS